MPLTHWHCAVTVSRRTGKTRDVTRLSVTGPLQGQRTVRCSAKLEVDLNPKIDTVLSTLLSIGWVISSKSSWICSSFRILVLDLNNSKLRHFKERQEIQNILWKASILIEELSSRWKSGAHVVFGLRMAAASTGEHAKIFHKYLRHAAMCSTSYLLIEIEICVPKRTVQI